jgi:hypothetical protein
MRLEEVRHEVQVCSQLRVVRPEFQACGVCSGLSAVVRPMAWYSHRSTRG